MEDTTTLVQVTGVVITVLTLLPFLYRKVMGNTLDGFVHRLKQNDPELTELNLCSDGIVAIGDNGAEQVAAALVRNTTLTSLDLNGMNIGDYGTEKLASVLLLNNTLSVIRLHRNHISNKGAEKLAKALRHNHTVKTMYVSTMNCIKGNEINSEIQRLVTLNKEGPEEAARKKAGLFGSGWVAEGIQLKKQAEQEFMVDDESPESEESKPLLSSGGPVMHHKSE